MPTNNPEDTLPPFSSPPDPNVPSVGPSPETPPPSTSSPVDPAPPIEFLPYIDETEEKRKFWQAVMITMAIFFVLTVLVAGFIVSQRLSNPSDSKVNVQYVDSAPDGGPLPTRQPTRAPTPAKMASVNPVILPLTKIPTSRPTVPKITYVAQGSTTPGSTIPVSTGSPTVTITGSITPSVTLLPTTTPTITPTFTVTPTPSNTPTTIPTPTAYIVTSVDSYNYGTVFAGSSVTATFQIYNTGGTSLTISSLSLATTGTSNPYSITSGGGCITSSDTPIVLTQGTQKCVNILFAPTYTTVNSNTLQIWWNGSSIKNITLLATVPTPTPTPTP